MKEKIFRQMRKYGWNLGDNSNRDFENVYNEHYNFIQSLYDYFVETDEINISRNLNNINEQMLYDMIGFISDFLRAINDIDNEEDFKLNLVSNYITTRGISFDMAGRDLMAIIDNNEEDLEDLIDRLERDLEANRDRLEICGYDSFILREIKALEDEIESLKKLI